MKDWLDQIQTLKLPPLQGGGHNAPEEGLCAMEMVAFMEREPHSDHPQCTSPAIAAFVRFVNDVFNDHYRQRLLPWLPALVGTVDAELEPTRTRHIVRELILMGYRTALQFRHRYSTGQTEEQRAADRHRCSTLLNHIEQIARLENDESMPLRMHLTVMECETLLRNMCGQVSDVRLWHGDSTKLDDSVTILRMDDGSNAYANHRTDDMFWFRICEGAGIARESVAHLIPGVKLIDPGTHDVEGHSLRETAIAAAFGAMMGFVLCGAAYTVFPRAYDDALPTFEPVQQMLVPPLLAILESLLKIGAPSRGFTNPERAADLERFAPAAA